MTQQLTDADAERAARARGAGRGLRAGAYEACAFCLQRHNLRRTLRIALVVGVVLTLINQGRRDHRGPRDGNDVGPLRAQLRSAIPGLERRASQRSSLT